MKKQSLALGCAAALVLAVSSAHATTITFTGLRAGGQGLIGNEFVPAAATPWAANYAFLGTAGPYTRLTTPDAFNFVTGGELPLGTNLPAQPFGATAPAPHGLDVLGITGTLHLGIAGLVVDYLNPADLFFSDPFHETRFYRNGHSAVFEETAPGVFNVVAEYTGLVARIDIDYTTGNIATTVSGTRSAGTPSYFPQFWTGTSFDPVDNAGVTDPGGPYGRFSTSLSMEVDTTSNSIPEPGTLALVGLGLAALGRRIAHSSCS